MADLFGPVEDPPSIREIVVELERERATREKVYAKFVRFGSMTAATKAYRIKCLDRAIELLAELENGGRA